MVIRTTWFEDCLCIDLDAPIFSAGYVGATLESAMGLDVKFLYLVAIKKEIYALYLVHGMPSELLLMYA